VNETSFLAKYLREEFLLARPCEERDLVLLKSTDPELVNPLRRLVQPYIEGLYVLLHIINSGFSTVKEINGNYKLVTGELVQMGATSYAEIMAIDKTQRHLHNLVKIGHLKRIKR
jgi:ribosomal protein L21E